MPCYEVRTVSVEFNMKNIGLLKKAANELGFYFNDYTMQRDQTINVHGIKVNLKTGIAKVPEGQFNDWNRLKRNYSAVVIKEIAKKKRWIVKQNGNKLTMKKW